MAMNSGENRRELKSPNGIRVNVYGGGVTGMTAAHELATRGFEVHVYECEEALGAHGTLEEGALGGMARTQYFALTEEQKSYHDVAVTSYKLLQERIRKLIQDRATGTDDEKKEHAAMVARELSRGPVTMAMAEFLTQLVAHSLSRRSSPHGAVKSEYFSDLFGEELSGEFAGKALGKLKSEFTIHRELQRALGISEGELNNLGETLDAIVDFLGPKLEGKPNELREAVELMFGRSLHLAAQGRLQVVVGSLTNYEDLFVSPPPFLAPLIEPLRKLLQAVAWETNPLRPLHEKFNTPGQGPEAANYFPQVWLQFKPSWGTTQPTTLETGEDERLREACEFIKKLEKDRKFETEFGPCDVKILIQVFKDPSQRGDTQRQQGNKPELDPRSKYIKGKLQAELHGSFLQNRIWDYDEFAERFPEATALFGLAPVTRDWVRVIVYRPQLPGEHGYRFFPSYYRHVFDTMRRIPLYNANGLPINGTVLDNLVPLPEIGLFTESSAPVVLSWSPLQVGDALSRAEYGLRSARALHVHPQDLLQFSLRVLRYMTSCPQRRAAEMEDLSWWEYLEGYDPRTCTRLYHYSKPFQDLVQSSSRVLVALDGAHGDARTCGNTYVQLLTEALVPSSRNNCTLNGPTSESWFFHWKNHLKRLGVRFHYGRLNSLEWSDGRLIAQMVDPKNPEGKLEPHVEKTGERLYFVVATDLVSAAKASRLLKTGVAAQLWDYSRKVPKERGSNELIERDPETDLKRNAWDRLQTISGIQYFFEKKLSVFDGYIYCVDAEWGLSAICSQIVWQDPPIDRLSSYQSVLSVDIGDWNKRSKRLGLAAWECTRETLQGEVLHQLSVALASRGPDQAPASFVLPTPDWVHIDKSLVFKDGNRDEDKKLLKNRTPYLVPIAGDWKHRPGPAPWDPTPGAPRPANWHLPESVWQSPHGGYPVHYGRLVYAGTYLRTFTRLTTMESANESARHAVNAILDHCAVFPTQAATGSSFWYSPARPAPSTPYDQGVYPTTPHGDYCRIWDPERHELPDFELLQRKDEENFLKGCPHAMDSWGMELLPSLLTHIPSTGMGFDLFLRLVESCGRRTGPQATHALLAVLRQVRTLLERRGPPYRR